MRKTFTRGFLASAALLLLAAPIFAASRQMSDGKVVLPPLWGARSYNWRAGMVSIKSD